MGMKSARLLTRCRNPSPGRPPSAYRDLQVPRRVVCDRTRLLLALDAEGGQLRLRIGEGAAMLSEGVDAGRSESGMGDPGSGVDAVDSAPRSEVYSSSGESSKAYG